MSDQQIIDTPENWDEASQGYAEKIAPVMMETFAEEFVIRLDVNSNTEALEVAAGSGALTTTLAKNVKSLTVFRRFRLFWNFLFLHDYHRPISCMLTIHSV